MTEMTSQSEMICVDEGSRATLPLTREQEGLWVEWKLSPLGISYNTCIQMKLEGSLDSTRFEHAIATVVSRFELLRAYCVDVHGMPRFALSSDRFSLETIDLTDHAEPEDQLRFGKAMSILARRRDAAIDLTQFPLIRAALVQTDPHTYYFIGVVPHIISDGYGALSIIKAVSIAYNEGPTGLTAAYGERPVDWSDFVKLRSRQEPARRQAAIIHWQQVLAGAQHIVPLGSAGDGPRSAIVDTHGSRFYFSFDGETLKRFNRLARSRRTSFFSVMAALYATILYRLTGQSDLVIVFPVNIRPPGFRDAFGMFVNLIPLRVDVSGNPSFADLVDRIGQRRRDDKPHQHLPGLDIVRNQRETSPGFDGRLSNVSLAQTVSRFEGLNIPGLVCSALDNDAIHVRDDLSLMYELSEDMVGLWLEYRQSMFTAHEIRALARRFQRIVEAVDADPEVRIADVELLEPQERTAVLARGAGRALTTDVADYATLFSRSATAHSAQVALRYGQTSLSYEELQISTAALAAHLAARRGPVAVIVERSIEQIVVMLAALQAGVPYVPLDPSQGRERTVAILRELQPAWVACPADTVLALGDPWVPLHLNPSESMPSLAGRERLPSVHPAATAYVIYTSGSTGLPKGVQVSHSAMVNRMAWLMQTFPLQPGEAVLQNTSYAFDVSVAEIFWPLASGATLVLSDPAHARDPRYLRRLIHDRSITTALFVPSALRSVLPGLQETRTLATLKRVLCAGEPLPTDVARRFFRCTGARLFNVYGPTEATIYATWKEITPDQEAISIGWPISNTSCAVVNDSLRLQPPDVEGELCISGPGLADGYFAREDLTRQRFLDGVIDGQRWYRTGDRVRMRPDGEMFFVGRIDRQIKLRGHRIELGEIESVLLRQPHVIDAVVVAEGRQESSGPRTLAAIVAHGGSMGELPPANEHPLAPAKWRQTLSRYLPDYMVPNTLEWVDSIPRLASGKLDSGRLPATTSSSPAAGDTPLTPEQTAMARVWAEVLGLPHHHIGLNSNFFELGGDSLMLIALATKLENEGVYIGVNELFEHPTISEALPRASTKRQTLISQAPMAGRFPALPRHRKFFADDFAHPAHWNRSFLLRFRRLLDVDALQRAVNAIVQHHDGLRASFHRNDGDPFFRVHPLSAVTVPIQTFDLTDLPVPQRAGAMIDRINQSNASLMLEHPPLIQVLLFDDEHESALALVVHHLLIDMRSCQILLEDLLTAYQTGVSHRTIRLPAKTTSTAEWSERLSAVVTAEWRIDELPFWEHQLRHVGHPVPFDHDAPGPPIDGEQHVLELELSRLQTDALARDFCVELSVGVQEVLLAAFAEAFRGWSSSPRLVVNTCGIGRDSIINGIDLSRTVGELNTVFPLHIDLTPRDTLATVRAAFDVLPHRGLHYGMLRYLARHATLQAPEPEVFFNYVSRTDDTIEAALDVTVEMAPKGVCSSHPMNRNCYALYLEAIIRHGRLCLHLGYDSARFEQQTAERLLNGWRDSLIDLLASRSAAPAAATTNLPTENDGSGSA